MCYLVARSNGYSAIHSDVEVHIVLKSHLADVALVETANAGHLLRYPAYISLDVGRGSGIQYFAQGRFQLAEPLNRMIGEAQRAAQSSAVGFFVSSAIVIPTNANAEVIASLR